MPNNDLEGKIGVVVGLTTFQNIKIFLTDTPGLSRQFNESNIEPILTLDKATLDAYKVIIVEKNHLNSDVLADNYKTPVILYQNEDMPDQKDIIANYNLFRVANNGTIFEDARAAIAAHRTIQEFLDRNLSGRKILESMVPPKFRNTLRIIEDDKKSRERLQQRIQGMPLKDALWEAVIEDMQKVEHGEKPEPLAHNIVDFLVRYPQFEREDSIRKMGDDESGEDTILSTDPQKQSGYMKDASKRFTILRVIEPRIVHGEMYTAKEIANQRFNDARWCHTKERREEFKTPYVLAPFHFEDLSQEEKERLKKEFPEFDTNRSILIFEEIPGHRFYKSLITLKQGIKDSEKKIKDLRNELEKADMRTERGKELEELAKDELARRRKIHTVGRGFIEKSLKDCAFWTKCGTEMLAKNKPSPNELVDFYIKQIDKTPAAIRERSTIEVSAEEEAFFKNATDLLYLMAPHIKKEHIVRNRDSWVGNAVLRDIPINFSIDQYLKRFMNGQKPNDTEIASVFENIDMQYRWGHVLEDWAQLIAAYESSFLLQFNERHKTFESENILELKNNFLVDSGGNSLLNELKDEHMVTYSILLYRAVRKMYLFTNYWDNTCRALADKKMEAKLKPRRERFTENIEHYAIFGKLVCKKIAIELNHVWNGQNPNKVERELINNLGNELKNDYYTGDKIFEGDIAKKCNDLLSNPDLTSEGKNIIRAYGLASFLEKIYGGFRKREYLKTLYQKGDKDGQS